MILHSRIISKWVHIGLFGVLLFFYPFGSSVASSQLAEAEYFFNDDPGEGMGTSISGTFGESTETLNFDVSTSGLSEGEHKVYVRFKDANGQWGSPRGRLIKVSEQADFSYSLNRAEYFINDDPGEGNGTPINTSADGSFDGNEESIDMDVNLPGLSDGFHTIYTRFQDNTGSWGPKKGFQFKVESSEDEDLIIQAAEYYIGADPGVGNGTPLAAPSDGAFDEAIEELEANITLSNMSVGRHYVYFRVQASNGRWGAPRGVPFQVENIAFIDRAEYYFNNDPGEGNGIAIAAPVDGSFNGQEENIDLDIEVSETGLAEGQHTLYIRFRNSKGEWSQPSSRQITIQTKPAIVVSTDTLNFGEHVVEDSVPLTFTVQNEGDAPLEITDITSSSPEFTVSETTGSIPANSDNQLSFTVNFEPTSAGQKNAVLTIANNDQSQTIRLLGSALAKEPIVELSKSAVDFGTVIVGDSVSSYVAIYNTGYDTLKLTSATINSDEFSANPSSGSLLPQSSLTDSLVINVAMVPDTEGNKTATLTLAGNFTSKQVSLSGTAELNPEPTISVSTDSLAFSAVEISEDSIRTLQIRNLGTQTLTISSFQITGNAFSGNVNTPVSIERGSPLDVPITFSPETASLFTGSIEIESNDADDGTVRIELSGEGTLGPPTRILTITPEEVDFGQVTQGQTAQQNVSLQNEGNATLKITGIASNESEFFVENGPTPTNPLFILAGGSQDVAISFSPSAGDGQTFTAEIAFSSDRTDGSAAITISAEGIGVDQPTPNIQLSTRSLNFGELRVDETETRSFTLTNGGNAALSVSGVSTNNGAFSITAPSSTSFSLQPSQQQDFEVAFTPNSVSAYTATLTINSNIDPVDIQLSGEGVTLSAGVDSTELRSNEEPVTSGQSVSVSISPTGLGDNGSAHLYYKAGGGGSVSSYTRVAMTSSPNGSYSAAIPSNVSSDQGISYWFEVSDGIETVTSPVSNPNLRPYTISVEVPDGIAKNSPQPAGSDQNFYRMISVPLTGTSGVVDTVLSNFGAADADSWRLFRWQSGRYVEHNESGFESFAPGRAYWFITTAAATIQSGAGVSPRTDEPYSIFLQPGWNMIGSPFTYPIAWSESDVPAGVENLWHYDGSGFVDNDEMIPWRGYFVQNTTNNPVEVKLTSIEAGSGSNKENPANRYGIDPEKGWGFKLAAESGIVRDQHNIAGVQALATDQKDEMDLRDAPKQPGEFLQLAFINEEQKLSVDLRSLNSQGHFWDFEVHTNSSAASIQMDLTAIGEIPSGFEVHLIDKDQRSVWNITAPENRKRSFRTALGDTLTRSFRMVVGSTSFIDQNNLGITELPDDFVLKQNYPNPFNPSTTIAFGLPEQANVKLEIYNSIGRKVATLIDEQMNAGYHDLIWDASSVASGMYFYRITARGQDSRSSFSKIHKMMLIK